MTVAYVGRPRAVVVFTADRDGAPTPGYVAAGGDPIPPELAALVDGAWPNNSTPRKPARMSIRALTDRTLVPGGLRFGAPEPSDGPHFWELVLPRDALPDRLAVLVLDDDGTIRRATDR